MDIIFTMPIIVGLTMALVEVLKKFIEVGKAAPLYSLVIGAVLYGLSAYAGFAGHSILMMLVAGLTASGTFSLQKSLK